MLRIEAIARFKILAAPRYPLYGSTVNVCIKHAVNVCIKHADMYILNFTFCPRVHRCGEKFYYWQV